MSRLSDLVSSYYEPRMRLPEWFDRLASLGIVTSDPKVARRQRFTNVASYLGVLNTSARFIQNFSHDFENMFFVQAIVGFYLLWALIIHRLHRFGDNVAAVALVIWFVSGLTLVVVLFGLQSGAQYYFVAAGVILIMYGVEHWRLFLVTFVGILVVALVVLNYGHQEGVALAAGAPLVGRLQVQAIVITLLINNVVIAYALVVLRRAERGLKRQSARADALVSVVLPERIARRLRAEPDRRIADRIDGISVLFADLSGFTAAAHRLPPEAIVAYLGELVAAFDGMCAEHGVEKIKTIGDAYMAVAWLNGDKAASAVAIGRFALAMLDAQARRPPLGEHRLSLRVGIHTGTAIAGVIGDTRVTYDVWGDAVNIASRMESHGVPGRIHVSEAYRRAAAGAFAFEERGDTEIKGIGSAHTYFLLRAAEGA
jgi:adenylate cyclase